MYEIEIEPEELNRPRRSCSIDEETIGTRFKEMTSHGIWSIVNSKQEAKDAKREHDHEETNEEKDKATSHEQSRTQSENNQARWIDITIHLITERRGLLKGPEKELNDAMSEQESKKTTWRNEKLEFEHRKVHSLPRVRILSKGAEAKYDQKQMLMDQKNQEILRSKVRQVTSAIKNGRETYSATASCQKKIAAVALPLRPLLLHLLLRGSPLSTKFSTTRNTSLRLSTPLDRSGSDVAGATRTSSTTRQRWYFTSAAWRTRELLLVWDVSLTITCSVIWTCITKRIHARIREQVSSILFCYYYNYFHSMHHG